MSKQPRQPIYTPPWLRAFLGRASEADLVELFKLPLGERRAFVEARS